MLSTKDIVEMSTSNAASVIALSNQLGRLAPGFKADLFVVGGDASVPYDALVAAWPSTVRLVMVDGIVLYGDDQLEAAGPTNPGCEALDVCGRAKFLCTAEASSANKLNQSFVEIRDNLNAALMDLDTIPVLPFRVFAAMRSARRVRTVMPVVDASLCPTACGAGEQCFQRAQSGSNMYACMTVNACSPKRPKKFHPVTPLFACP